MTGWALVHGRFQPPHRGHEALISRALDLRGRCLVLVGNVGRRDDRHPYSFVARARMLRAAFPDPGRVRIAPSYDLGDAAPLSAWTLHLAGRCIDEIGALPDVVVAGPDYDAGRWDALPRTPFVDRFAQRTDGLSATAVREAIAAGDRDLLARTLSPQVAEHLHIADLGQLRDLLAVKTSGGQGATTLPARHRIVRRRWPRPR